MKNFFSYCTDYVLYKNKNLVVKYKYFLTIILIAFAFTVKATNYYVSTSGNDSNPGTSQDAPWQSLEKVNSFIPSPGDQILFKRGDAWTGTITVKASGTAGSPITYGAYGTGERPKIYGSEIISGWTKHKGYIYKTTIDTEMEQIFVNNTRQQLARFPKTGWLTMDKTNESIHITSSELNGDFNYVGATIIHKPFVYMLKSKEIIAQENTTLTMDSPTGYGLKDGFGFFLCNKLEFVTQAGDWFYDTKTKTLYLWAPNNDNPDNYEIRASTIEHGIYGSHKSYINIENFEISQTKSHGIFMDFSPNLYINNNKIINTDRSGILAWNSSNNTVISNNYVYGCGAIGIYLRGTDTQIINNEIHETGRVKNINKRIKGSKGNGITLMGKNGIVKYNKIYNSSYLGILLDHTNLTVQYNYIDGACLDLDDGGGIYAYNGHNYQDPGIEGSVISDNIILNVTGNFQGTTQTYKGGTGIYMDNNIHDVDIERNLISNCATGIFTSNGGNMLVDNNTIHNTMMALTTGPTYDTKYYTNNTIFASNRQATYIWWKTNPTYQRLIYDQNVDKLIVNYNHYYAPYSTKQVFTNFNSFEEYKAETGYDKNGTFDGTQFTNGEIEKLFYNNTKKTKTIPLESYVYRDLKGKQVTGAITLEPFTSVILIKTKTKVDNTNQTPVIKSQNFDIYNNKQENESIGQVIATDPDTKQILYYSITQGNEGDLFYINPTTGEIFTNSAIETSKNITIDMVIEVTDNASIPLSASNNIAINIHERDYDTSPPIINEFTIPTTVKSLEIQITKFDASDDKAIVGYYLSESPTSPQLKSSGWLATPPTSYTFAQSGDKTLHAWVKDAAGNVSDVFTNTTKISLYNTSATFSEYLFDEPDGVKVFDSKETNNGVIENEASRINGISENGLKFTKNGYVNLGQCFGDNVQNEVTLSAWIKPETTQDNYQGIIMHGGPIDDTYALYINPKLKSISFKTSGTTSAWLDIRNVDELWDGNWHFLTATYDGAQKNIYLDGKTIISADASGSIISGEGYNLLIGAGRDITSPTLLYHGLIDEVRVYNYALDDTEITDLHELIDTIAPAITSFEIPSTSKSLNIPIVSFNAIDNKKVSAFYLNEDSATPSADDIGWQSSIPTEYRFSQRGDNMLYAWVKDASGNISNVSESSITIPLPDLSPIFSEYLFEETSGITAIDSKGSNDGSIFNNGTRVHGVSKNALKLNGEAYVNLGQCFGRNVQNEVSLSAWIKPDANSKGYQGIIMHGGTNDDTYALYINPTSKSIGFKTTGTTSSWVAIDNVDVLWDGDWHHLAAVYTGSQKIIYLDNKPIITSDASGTIEPGDGYNLLIGAGRDKDTPTLLYNGLIDEVRIYNYALNDSDINELYHLIDIFTTEDISICEGSSYQGWASAGQYQRVLQSFTGRDSTVTTNLWILPNYHVTEDVTIIEGEDYYGFTQTGQYERTLTSVDGCDSIVTTNLNVLNHFSPIWENENGQNHMNIYIADAQIEGEPIQPNDEIAIFDGNVCVGTTKLTSTINPNDINGFAHIIASQNDENNNGFIEGNTISFVIWDASERVEKKATNINYKRDYAEWITTGKFVPNGTSVVEIGIAKEKILQTQSINFKKGWNIFSSYLIPTNTNMDSVQSKLRNNGQLLKVQDESGNTYEEWNTLDKWVNSIGKIQETEGYKIKVNSSCILDITGYQIDLPLNIDIQKGWNIISFPINGSVDAIQTVQTLINDGILEKIMDEEGNSIENWGHLGWLNNIGHFRAGKGYKVKVNSDGILPIYETHLKSKHYNIKNTKTSYFKVDYEGNGSDHMNINIINLNETNLKIGDEIAAFDNDICVGAVKLNDTNFRQGIVSVKASVSEDNMENGFTVGNSITLKTWHAGTNQPLLQQQLVVEGEMIFNRNASVFIKLINHTPPNIEDPFFNKIKMYPNPASNNVTIKFTVQPENGTKIILTDILGRQLLSQDVTSAIEVIDIQSQNKGIYFVKIVSNNKHKTNRLIIK